MQLHQIHDSSNEFVMNLLEATLSNITDNDIIKNYHPDYKNNPANIFYILNFLQLITYLFLGKS